MSNHPHLSTIRGARSLSGRAAAVVLAGAATISFLAVPAGATGGFTSGDLVVYRVGTGTGTLSSASTAVFLDEYLPTGSQAAPAFTLDMPTTTGTGTATNPLTASGSATSEGGLTLSTDGSVLLVPGYDAAAGSSGSIVSSTVPREAGEVDAAGDIDTTTTFGTTAFSGNNPRSAASVDGSAIWMGGAGATESSQGGVWYATKGATTSTALTFGNFRWAEIFGGQLHCSSGSATSPAMLGVNQIGNGLPTSSPVTITPFAGVDTTSGASPYAYYLLSEKGNGIDTAYVAESATGILKYSLISGTWTAEGSVALSGATGLTGTLSAGTVTLYATNPGSLVKITDPVGTGALSGTPTVLATSATNEAFRGVAFAPTALGTALPEAPLVVGLPLAAIVLGGGTWVTMARRRRTA